MIPGRSQQILTLARALPLLLGLLLVAASKLVDLIDKLPHLVHIDVLLCIDPVIIRKLYELVLQL